MPDQNTINPEDLTLDDLFTIDSQEPAGFQPQVEPQVQTEPQAAPQRPYLQASTGTVYNTHEDAVRGTEEKDRQLEQMRQTFIAMHGYDPISGKPVRFNPYNNEQEVNYARDPERLYDDLAKANGDGNRPPDKRAYAAVMQKLLHDTYGPVMTQSAKTVTLTNLERRYPGITSFVEGDKYRDYLSERELLSQAIQASETQPGMQAQLADLYVLAYEGANGRNLPQILKTARETSSPTNPTSSSAPRPTLQPTSQPAPSGTSVAPDMSTPEGRKAIIEAGRARGLDKQMLF